MTEHYDLVLDGRENAGMVLRGVHYHLTDDVQTQHCRIGRDYVLITAGHSFHSANGVDEPPNLDPGIHVHTRGFWSSPSSPR